jgi:hypothetical protein
MYFAPGSTRGLRNSGGMQTDDLGHFRLYGLMPGEYVIVAEARGPTFVQPNAPPETEDDKIGFMTTYYPGTPDEAAAQRIRAKTATETPGVELRMVTGRLFRVSGTITDSQGRAASRVNGQLVKRIGTGSTSGYGFSTDEMGRFQMRNIAPGTYRLVVRGRIGGPPSEPAPGEAPEFGSIALNVASDLEGIVVTTAPGATISGQIVFEPAPRQLPAGQQSFQMRVNAQYGESEMAGGPPPSPGIVTPDLTFTMKGLNSEMLLRTSGPNMFLKSVTVSGRDVTDTPYEFKNGDQVTIVVSTRSSTLEGIVTDSTGKPVTDAGVIVFAEDKGLWRMNSTRTRRGSVDSTTGKYRVSGLMPGRYIVVATTRERLNGSSSGLDVAFFEPLAKEGTAFVIGDDEQRQVDLRVITPGG